MILDLLWHQRKFYFLLTDFLAVAHEYFKHNVLENFHLAFQVEIKVCRKQGPYLGIVLERKLLKLRFRKKTSLYEECTFRKWCTFYVESFEILFG